MTCVSAVGGRRWPRHGPSARYRWSSWSCSSRSLRRRGRRRVRARASWPPACRTAASYWGSPRWSADPMPPAKSFKDIAVWAWRSTRLFAFVLLAVALIVGAHLRFHRLARFDMSGDEGASWAAASAPSLQQVADIERRGDPGKLALYDVLLHEWIADFGDSLFAMRAMSAALGT